MIQTRIAVVLIIAALCVGALADRVYTWWVTSDDVPAYAGTPPSTGDMPATGGVNMQNCMDGAVRRGMTRDQASHACAEIVN